LEDIRYSLDIDDQNPYAYRSLGICQMEQGNFNEALSNFEKAKQLHPDTYQIDQLIRDARYRGNPAV
jgi:tetratricopeptide (TPR) repeat protein